MNPEQVTVESLHLPIKKPSDAYLSMNSITKISEEPNLESDMQSCTTRENKNSGR